MTHIVHPYAHRLGILRDWRSRWYAHNPKKYREFLRTDALIRKFLSKRLKGAYVSHVEIERSQKTLRVIIHTARPGQVIGRQGDSATKLKKDLSQLLKSSALSNVPSLSLDIVEIRQPESNAAIVAAMIVEGLEKRMPFRRVTKQTMDKVMANRDVLGCRISLSGIFQVGGMARTEVMRKGRVPLQTLRANIEYAQDEATLQSEKVGIKVWIYFGDVFADRAGGKDGAKGGLKNHK